MLKSETTYYHIFPQGFRISKNIGHPTLGSGGKKMFKRYLKSEQTDKQTHCEILDSYLQQPLQHHVFKAYFEAEPHSQAEANKWQQIFCLISRSKLPDSLETGSTLLPCSPMWIGVSVGQAGINAWSELLRKFSMICFEFVGIPCCCSASLELCVCDAAYHWSQGPSAHSQ